MWTIHFGETGDFVSKDAIWGQFLTDRDRSAYGRSSRSRNGVRGDQLKRGIQQPPFPRSGLLASFVGFILQSNTKRLELHRLGVAST